MDFEQPYVSCPFIAWLIFVTKVLRHKYSIIDWNNFNANGYKTDNYVLALESDGCC